MFEINIPKEVELALNILNKNYDAYIVGGCVRDSLLGKSPADWDITTSAKPKEVLEFFKDFKTIETGLKHGTVTVLINGMPIEITTYRIDGEYLDNRRPNYVDFTNNLALDLKRRDFTINALVYNEKGVVDLFDGVNDLELRRIRCVGDPDKRFNEDGLRILRALRFASILIFNIDAETSNSIHKNRHLLTNIAVERIISEFNRLITGYNFHDIMYEYKDVIEVFIQEIKYIDKESWDYTLNLMNNVSNDLVMKLTMLFIGVGKFLKLDSKNIADLSINVLRRLKYDTDTINNTSNLLLNYDSLIIPDKKVIKRWLNKLGVEKLKQLLEVKKSVVMSDDSVYDYDLKLLETNKINSMIDEIISNKEVYSLKQLAVNGDDLINYGIDKGKQLGEILNKLLEKVINEELNNKRDELLNYIKNIKQIKHRGH